MGKQWINRINNGSELRRSVIGISSAIKEVRRLIRYAASADSPVMITGPSGSGKEVVANAIHNCSPRHEQNFVAVNCGAIPRDLLESELFGHEKGSFTGAIARRIGRFEAAHNGSLLLDEIGDMPTSMQVKLLRVLEERSIDRVGGNAEIPIDTRIISATHRHIGEEIKAGTFREDLYFRLSVFPIDIPPLNARVEDIPVLMRHFLDQLGIGGRSVSFTPAAIEQLLVHDWPGNARELRNVAERAAIFFPHMEIAAEQISTLFRRRMSNAPSHGIADRACSSHIEPLDVGYSGHRLSYDHPFNLKAHLNNEEREVLTAALQMADGVVANAARLTGLQRTTFVEKMKRHKITRSSICEPSGEK